MLTSLALGKGRPLASSVLGAFTPVKDNDQSQEYYSLRRFHPGTTALPLTICVFGWQNPLQRCTGCSPVGVLKIIARTIVRAVLRWEATTETFTCICKLGGEEAEFRQSEGSLVWGQVESGI